MPLAKAFGPQARGRPRGRSGLQGKRHVTAD